ASFVSDDRPKPDIDGDRDCDNGQRNQKELNGQSWRRGECVSRRVFALDQFFHVPEGVSPRKSRVRASFTICVLYGQVKVVTSGSSGTRLARQIAAPPSMTVSSSTTSSTLSGGAGVTRRCEQM